MKELAELSVFTQFQIFNTRMLEREFVLRYIACIFFERLVLGDNNIFLLCCFDKHDVLFLLYHKAFDNF